MFLKLRECITGACPLNSARNVACGPSSLADHFKRFVHALISHLVRHLVTTILSMHASGIHQGMSDVQLTFSLNFKLLPVKWSNLGGSEARARRLVMWTKAVQVVGSQRSPRTRRATRTARTTTCGAAMAATTSGRRPGATPSGAGLRCCRTRGGARATTGT